jgi:2,4-dienoyl-CoA reductase-like NADH-dependent reductase (Old Yellow Enzyme family)
MNETPASTEATTPRASSVKLFTPITLRGLTLPNRIVVSPMCQYCGEDGVPTDWHLMHLGQYLVAGLGLVITEAAAVEPRGRIGPTCVGLYSDEAAEGFARIVGFGRRWGNAKLGVQLNHAGRKASCRPPWEGRNPLAPNEDDGWPTLGPSALPFDEGWQTPKEMDHGDLDTVRDAFAQAARRADAAGLDMIEIHGAHGYLLSSFLSPSTNTRTDDYGGSLENRMRFPLEVFAAVRAAWPEAKPIGFRISATEWVEGGWGIADSVVFARELKAMGCDYVTASSGGFTPMVAVYEDRHRKNRMAIPVGPGYQVPLAAEIRAKAGIATMAVGMIRDAELAESVVAEGKADMVALARGLLYEPHWAWRAAEELGAEAAYPRQYERAKPSTWPEAFAERRASEGGSSSSGIA